MNLGINPPERRIEFPHHVAEWGRQRRPPPDQHIVVAGAQFAAAGRRHSHHLPQSPAHAVTLDGIAHLSRYGEPDAGGPTLGASARLQHEGAARRPHATRHRPKIAPAFQPLNDNDGTGIPITH